MKIDYTFPFGQKVRPVLQTDKTPKKVFILGVYASAVHASWIDPNDRIIVRALAVASEPYIFWRGESSEEIIHQITIPTQLGILKSASEKYNGPSGKVLDEYFLNPLGIDRNRAWLCDLVPHTCLNPQQEKAITEKYNPKRSEYDLPEVTIPKVPTRFANDNRRQEILLEVKTANPSLIILLGDQPIKWFLSAYTKHHRLTDFQPYGDVHPVALNGKTYNILPLVHPRQAGALSSHSSDWTTLHRTWMNQRAKNISKKYL